MALDAGGCSLVRLDVPPVSDTSVQEPVDPSDGASTRSALRKDVHGLDAHAALVRLPSHRAREMLAFALPGMAHAVIGDCEGVGRLDLSGRLVQVGWIIGDRLR